MQSSPVVPVMSFIAILLLNSRSKERAHVMFSYPISPLPTTAPATQFVNCNINIFEDSTANDLQKDPLQNCLLSSHQMCCQTTVFKTYYFSVCLYQVDMWLGSFFLSVSNFRFCLWSIFFNSNLIFGYVKHLHGSKGKS